MFHENDHVIEYVDTYLHGALDEGDTAYLERHAEACPICKVALDEARKRQTVFGSLPACEAPERLIRATLQRVEAQERRWHKLRRRVLPSVAIALAASVMLLIGVNIYYATLTPSPYEIRLLGQTSLLAGTHGSLRVQLVNHTTGAALANVPVAIELRGGDHAITLAEFQTDAQGTGQPRFELPDWADGEYELVVSAKPANEPEILRQKVRLQRSWKLMLSSDKPVYQPGQTIHVRSLALRRPDLKPVARQETVFTIVDPKGNLIFKQREPSSAFGIAAADCELADEIIEGPYALACKIGDTESKLTVDVKKYVLPKFKIDVELDQPFYEPGQKVKGTVQVDYFFGKPVADGVVEVEVSNGDVGVEKGGSERETKIRAHTDGLGKATFELKVPDKLIGKEQNSGDARLSFVVAVQDTAGQKQSKTVSRVVTNQPLRIEVIPEAGTIVHGVANTVYLYVSYADGRPARAEVVVSGRDETLKTSALGIASFEISPESAVVDYTIRATDAEGKTGRKTVRLEASNTSRDFIVRTDKAVYDGGDTMKLTALGSGVEPVFLDILKDGQTLLTYMVEMKDGRGEQTLDLPADLFGTVELCAYRFGRDGLPVRKTRVLVVRQADQLSIRAELDKKEYRPGRSAKVDLTLTDAHGKPTAGAISLAAVDEAVFAVLDQAPGMERTFYLLEQQLLKPVYAIYPWAPDLKNAPPAEIDRFEQALFSRTVQTKESPRYSTVHSLAADSFPIKERNLEATQTRAYEGVKIAWLAIGFVIAMFGYLCLWLFARSEIVLALHLAGIVSLIPLLLVLVLTALAPAFRTYKLARTRASLESAAPEDLGEVKQFSKKGDRVFYGSAGEAPNAEFGGDWRLDGKSFGSQPPRVREWFPETLLWKPEILTDDQGHASLDIDLADSITTWRLTGSAVSGDGRLGAMQAPLRVFQPFFVDLNLPVSMTRNDEVSVPVVVYNYLDRPQTVKLTLQRDDGDAWFSLQGDAEQSLELKPNEVRATHYRLKVTKVGDHKLEVHALGSNVGDAIRRVIEVVLDGRRVEQVVNGTLQQPAEQVLTVPGDAVEGSPKLYVKIYPSTFSQLLEGLDGIFKMPYGCFEQTSSTTYPNVLALDYLRRNKKSVPDVEAKARQFIHLGYQRLLGFEVKDGGFDWFGRPPANLTLTAYGLMEFQDMARVHDVDPNLIARTRKWIMDKRKSDGSWSVQKNPIMHEDPIAAREELAMLASTAYIAWAVYGGQEPSSDARVTLDFLLAHRPEKIDDPHVLALVCNALLAIDPKSKDVKPYLDQLESLKKTSDDHRRVWWEQPATGRTTFYGSGKSGSIESTALAALALIQEPEYAATTRGALTWLVEQKDSYGTWHSTQATVLSLKALLAATDKPLGGDKERRIELKLNDQLVKEIVILPDQAEVMQQVNLSSKLVAGANRLSLAETSGTGVGYQIAFRYHVPESEKLVVREPLAIAIDYDRTDLAVGDTVKATATVANQMDKVAPMVILDLPIPAGFSMETDELAKLVSEQKIEKFQVNARSAVVYLRGLEPGKPLQLRYSLKAKMPVQVAVPAARVYEYYDTEKQGRGRPARMSVK
jgi:anti-sigma factor RsiW